MELYIKLIFGKTLILRVDPNDTILYVKQKIEEKEMIPVSQQRLIIAGKQMEDDRLLSDYGHRVFGTTIYLVERKKARK